MAYRISEISAASPDMSDEAFAELVASIREHGQLVPIWKSGDEIIDGRKRLRACAALGIEPVVVDVSSGQDPVAVAYSLNILRTHYTTSQRAMFASRRANLEKGENLRSAPRDIKGQVAEFGLLAKTISDVAEEAGVARSAVVSAKKIRRDAAPEVTAAVEAGALTLHSAQQIVKAVPKDEQPAAVAKVIGASRGKRQTPARVLSEPPVSRSSPSRPLAWRVERALDQLDNAIECLTTFLSEPGARRVPEFQQWAEQIGAARTKLTHILAARRSA